MSTVAAPAEIDRLKDRPRYYRLSELAEIWGKHPSAFTRYILKPKQDRLTGETFTLEAIKTPGEWLVPAGAVERYFARLTASRKGVLAPPAPEASAAFERRQDQVERQLAAAGF